MIHSDSDTFESIFIEAEEIEKIKANVRDDRLYSWSILAIKLFKNTSYLTDLKLDNSKLNLIKKMLDNHITRYTLPSIIYSNIVSIYNQINIIIGSEIDTFIHIHFEIIIKRIKIKPCNIIAMRETIHHFPKIQRLHSKYSKILDILLSLYKTSNTEIKIEILNYFKTSIGVLKTTTKQLRYVFFIIISDIEVNAHIDTLEWLVKHIDIFDRKIVAEVEPYIPNYLKHAENYSPDKRIIMSQFISTIIIKMIKHNNITNITKLINVILDISYLSDLSMIESILQIFKYIFNKLESTSNSQNIPLIVSHILQSNKIAYLLAHKNNQIYTSFLVSIIKSIYDLTPENMMVEQFVNILSILYLYTTKDITILSVSAYLNLILQVFAEILILFQSNVVKLLTTQHCVNSDKYMEPLEVLSQYIFLPNKHILLHLLWCIRLSLRFLPSISLVYITQYMTLVETVVSQNTDSLLLAGCFSILSSFESDYGLPYTKLVEFTDKNIDKLVKNTFDSKTSFYIIFTLSSNRFLARNIATKVIKAAKMIQIPLNINDLNPEVVSCLHKYKTVFTILHKIICAHNIQISATQRVEILCILDSSFLLLVALSDVLVKCNPVPQICVSFIFYLFSLLTYIPTSSGILKSVLLVKIHPHLIWVLTLQTAFTANDPIDKLFTDLTNLDFNELREQRTVRIGIHNPTPDFKPEYIHFLNPLPKSMSLPHLPGTMHHLADAAVTLLSQNLVKYESQSISEILDSFNVESIKLAKFQNFGINLLSVFKRFLETQPQNASYFDTFNDKLISFIDIIKTVNNCRVWCVLFRFFISFLKIFPNFFDSLIETTIQSSIQCTFEPSRLSSILNLASFSSIACEDSQYVSLVLPVILSLARDNKSQNVHLIALVAIKHALICNPKLLQPRIMDILQVFFDLTLILSSSSFKSFLLIVQSLELMVSHYSFDHQSRQLFLCTLNILMTFKHSRIFTVTFRITSIFNKKHAIINQSLPCFISPLVSPIKLIFTSLLYSHDNELKLECVKYLTRNSHSTIFTNECNSFLKKMFTVVFNDKSQDLESVLKYCVKHELNTNILSQYITLIIMLIKANPKATHCLKWLNLCSIAQMEESASPKELVIVCSKKKDRMISNSDPINDALSVPFKLFFLNLTEEIVKIDNVSLNSYIKLIERIIRIAFSVITSLNSTVRNKGIGLMINIVKKYHNVNSVNFSDRTIVEEYESNLFFALLNLTDSDVDTIHLPNLLYQLVASWCLVFKIKKSASLQSLIAILLDSIPSISSFFFKNVDIYDDRIYLSKNLSLLKCLACVYISSEDLVLSQITNLIQLWQNTIVAYAFLSFNPCLACQNVPNNIGCINYYMESSENLTVFHPFMGYICEAYIKASGRALSIKMEIPNIFDFSSIPPFHRCSSKSFFFYLITITIVVNSNTHSPVNGYLNVILLILEFHSSFSIPFDVMLSRILIQFLNRYQTASNNMYHRTCIISVASHLLTLSLSTNPDDNLIDQLVYIVLIELSLVFPYFIPTSNNLTLLSSTKTQVLDLAIRFLVYNKEELKITTTITHLLGLTAHVIITILMHERNNIELSSIPQHITSLLTASINTANHHVTRQFLINLFEKTIASQINVKSSLETINSLFIMLDTLPDDDNNILLATTCHVYWMKLVKIHNIVLFYEFTKKLIDASLSRYNLTHPLIYSFCIHLMHSLPDLFSDPFNAINSLIDEAVAFFISVFTKLGETHASDLLKVISYGLHQVFKPDSKFKNFEFTDRFFKNFLVIANLNKNVFLTFLEDNKSLKMLIEIQLKSNRNSLSLHPPNCKSTSRLSIDCSRYSDSIRTNKNTG